MHKLYWIKKVFSFRHTSTFTKHFTSTFSILAVMTIWPQVSVASKLSWQEGYVVSEGSQSPDGSFGVLIPGRESVRPEGTDVVNYLVDLKLHRIIGKIVGANYSEGENHRGLVVLWAADSKWCVVEYQIRFGFGSITVLDLLNSKMHQTEIGERVQNLLNGVISKESRSEEKEGAANAYYRLTSDRKLKVRAICTTNPKSFEDQKSYCSLFQGTFDPHTGNWIVTDVRSVNKKDFTALEIAYSEGLDKDTGFSSEEYKAEILDSQMNDVYAAVKLILPAKRFSEIKHDQIAWLKVRDASHSPSEKCKLIGQRIKALQNLLW